MVSTYLSYDLVVRDIKSSLNRTAADRQVTRESAYYEANIGNVTSVDEFLDDYRLYSFAMKAHGLEDMTYAKAFMRKVLESDLTDDNSYANKLTDDRYRNFAAAFSFSSATKIPQTETQTEEMIGLYNATIINRDEQLAEDTRYYEIMVDRTTNVDVFLHDDRLRDYVLTAYGIDRKTYNYDLVRGALSSDVSDPASYYNTVILPQANAASTQIADNNTILTAVNGRASAMTMAATMQSVIDQQPVIQGQIDDLELQKLEPAADVPALDAQIATLQAQLQAMYTAVGVTDVSEVPPLLSAQQTIINDYNAILPPVGAETTTLVNKLKEDNKRLQNIVAGFSAYEQLANAFGFASDGTVAAGSAQTAANKQATTNLYIFGQDRLTRTGALLNDEYYKSKIASIATVDELLADSRLVSYVKTAFGLTSAAVVSSTLEFVITSDPDDPASYLNQQYKLNKNYDNFVALARAFNFQADGTLASGDPAQTPQQLSQTSSRYFSGYDDTHEAADERAIKAYKNALAAFNTDSGSIRTVDELVGTKAVYEFAMQAVGLDPDEISKRTMKKVLMSDLDDPRSFANSLKDDRYVRFAQLFNFDGKGDLSWPAMAQDEGTIKKYAKNYIVQKTRFAEEDQKERLKKEAETEAEYYQDKIASLKTLDEFLGDRRLVDVALVAKRIDPSQVTDDFMKKVFASDLGDPKSFVHEQKDTRFAELLASFNFNEHGKVASTASGGIQTPGEVREELNLFLRQTLETEEGNNNPGVRLALYFERMAGTITSAYDILGDTALLEFFRTTYSLPAELSSMDIDQQARIVEKNLELADLADTDKLSKLVRRFTIMYELENGGGSSPSLSILMGGGNVGINADLLMSISQLRAG
ncbi:DUF1217 domain-containing protein [Ciceribacter selenitireducens]|uniref:Flagellar protein n=1 Tax=Ciceribacter selenitireducens ATCC BAA-1503 TaxID=1336235 RepID=A0A376ABF3_9HYPH|nr:DUF1217 domain-containing protein [Ciceribacter selenitireducens]SSC65094.1 unnamed protein product [Ciceribacter selenitireducens ATCC BAA-1503]